MNDQTATFNASAADALQARFARRIAAALSERSDALPADIGERLKFAREQALSKARHAQPAKAVAPQLAYASASGRGGSSRTPWGLRIGSVLPLVALVAGLFMIQKFEISSQISAAADVDTALLADDVPPQAYSDPGFVEFLKAPAN